MELSGIRRAIATGISVVEDMAIETARQGAKSNVLR
jgi:hypothetical protein